MQVVGASAGDAPTAVAFPNGALDIRGDDAVVVQVLGGHPGARLGVVHKFELELDYTGLVGLDRLAAGGAEHPVGLIASRPRVGIRLVSGDRRPGLKAETPALTRRSRVRIPPPLLTKPLLLSSDNRKRFYREDSAGR